ncbi:SdrD B-like domain-containing protein [Pedobacter sp. SYSU D00535]|uniref:SdrD B-like domain-containing protein n=1 Tax=Pedobacter sp. SYSU D00535 TaxID=2810308 RepID=UPI001A962E48|nr:SdrD B-like domain-containing protein [Pedobacter sp. SYSU D00535]
MNTNYTISPYDSLFIPVNLIPKKTSNGNVNHVINASLINDDNIQFGSAIWYLSIKKETDWNAAAAENKVFFLEGSNTAKFAIKLQNNGNAEEKIKINFASDRRLRVLDNSNTPIEIKHFNVTLPIKTDTTLYFTAEKLSLPQRSFREDFDVIYDVTKADVYPLKITVQNEADEYSAPKTWRTTIDFIRTGTQARMREYRYESAPLTIEANVDNILDNSTILNLSLYGNTTLPGNRSLIYRFQTFFADNFYSYLPYLGNSHYVGYTSPKTTVEIGDVSGSPNFGLTPTGRGIRVTQEVLRNHTFGAFYLQNPRLFNSVNRTDYGFSYGLRIGRTRFDNYFQRTENSLLKFDGLQYSNSLRLPFARNHSITLNSALSQENYYDFTTPVVKTGYAYAVNYFGAIRKFTFGFHHTYGSKFNTSYRGITSFGANVLYRFNYTNSAEANYYSYDQNPQYLSTSGFLLTSRPSASALYELKYTYSPYNYTTALKLQHQENNIFNLRTRSNGLGVDFRPRQTGNTRFYLSVFGAYNELPDYNLNPYFSAQLRTMVRHRGLTSSIRYFYGPYQTFEQLLFANTKVNNQSIYTNTNLKLWVLRNKLSFEPSFVYSYETLFKRHRISARPEFYYMPKSGLEFRFYGQYINNNQKNNPFINLDNVEAFDQSMSTSNIFFGFGFKKRIGVPVSGKKYKALKVAVFKDLNGNGQQDKNEQGIKNVLINVKSLNVDSTDNSQSRLKEIGENFVTDQQGKIAYNNLPKGEYKITLVPLSENSGFFAANERILSLKDDETVLMPLNQGVQLTGILMAQKDVVSADYERSVDVSKIRVTAIDSLGKIYSTLTDGNGRFVLKLPVGTYSVSVNENVLPENFELQQKRIVVDMLTVADNYNITFNMLEKKRKLNIKRFDQQGKVIETKDNNSKSNKQDE